jgi:ketosteroid isomerase-like protein
MKRFAVVPMLALLVVIFAAGRPVQEGLPDEDVAAIRAVFEAWGKAGVAEDVDGMKAMLDENFVHSRPNAVWVSADSFATIIKGWWADGRDEKVMDLGTLEVNGQGTLAFAWGVATEVARLPGNEEDTTWVFPWVASLRKMDDGQWKVVTLTI